MSGLAEGSFALSIALVPARTATPEEPTSASRRIDLENQRAHQRGSGGVWGCASYGGMPIQIGVEDEGAHVSFGAKARDERAGQQTLAPFNIYLPGSRRAAAGRRPARAGRFSGRRTSCSDLPLAAFSS